MRKNKLRVGLNIPDIDRNSIEAPTKYLINLAYALKDRIELYVIHNRTVAHPLLKEIQGIITPKEPILQELELRKHHLDIVHFNSIPSLEHLLLFKILNCKKVATIHGDIYWLRELVAEMGVNYYHPTYLIQRLMEPISCNFLDAIISVSHNLKYRLIKHLKLPESKIKVIHEGVSSAYKPLHDLSYIREKYNLEKPFILHVSNFSPKKNPQVLLKAFSILIKEGLNLDLIIVGARWNNKFVRNLISDSNLFDNVKILGYVPEQDLISLYNSAELFFFPSLHETFGFPIVEAMSCGTPVITSNVYSIPEVAGDVAILCDPQNYFEFACAIKHVLKDDKLKKSMRVKGLKEAKRFSWEKCAQDTVELYKQLLA